MNISQEIEKTKAKLKELENIKKAKSSEVIDKLIELGFTTDGGGYSKSVDDIGTLACVDIYDDSIDYYLLDAVDRRHYECYLNRDYLDNFQEWWDKRPEIKKFKVRLVFHSHDDEVYTTEDNPDIDDLMLDRYVDHEITWKIVE